MSTQADYSVQLQKERFTFCAAHFITYGDNVCEPLHGHNYAVSAEFFGPLGEHEYVIDFIAVRDILTELTRELDHRVILPTAHPTISVRQEGDEVVARFEERRWVFPASDCVLLPVANTTAELLAEFIAKSLRQRIVAQVTTSLEKIVVTVDECDGQRATCRIAGRE